MTVHLEGIAYDRYESEDFQHDIEFPIMTIAQMEALFLSAYGITPMESLPDNIIIECYANPYPIWVFHRFRPDKQYANPSSLLFDIIQLFQDNTVYESLKELLISRTNNTYQIRVTSNFHRKQEIENEIITRYFNAITAGHLENVNTSILTMTDLLWSSSSSLLSKHQLLDYLFKHEDKVVELHRERCQLHTAMHKTRCYIQETRVSLRYYLQAVARLLKGLFESSNTMDLDKTIASTSLKLDKKVECCIAMSSFPRSMMTTRKTLNNFLQTLSFNMKENGYLIAIMLDADAIQEYLREERKSKDRLWMKDGRYCFWADRDCWAGLVTEFTQYVAYEDETVFEEVAVEGLADPKSNFNQVMSDRGFLLQTALPVGSFTHLLPAYLGMFYEVREKHFHEALSLLKCVIWRRDSAAVAMTTTNAFEEMILDEVDGKKAIEQGVEANVTLMQLLRGSNDTTVSTTTTTATSSAPFISEASWSLLVYDYLDIRSHFQLALTCKNILRHYLRGSPSGMSLYSLRAIRSGLHIRTTIKTRENPLFMIKQMPVGYGLRDIYFNEPIGDGDDNVIQSANTNINTTDYCCLRIMNPYTYTWLQSIPCVDGCYGCQCSRKDICDVAEQRLKVNFDHPHNKDYHYVNNASIARSKEPELTESEQIALLEQGRLYYPYPVDILPFFCMCIRCFHDAFESRSRTGYGGHLRNKKMMNPMDRQFIHPHMKVSSSHHVSSPSSLIPLLILRSLFTTRMNVSFHFSSFQGLESPKESVHASVTELLLAELVPELFGFYDEHGHSHFRTAPVMSYLTKVREEVDDSFIQVWMMYEYGLAVELMHRGPPFPSKALCEPDEPTTSSYGDGYGDDDEENEPVEEKMETEQKICEDEVKEKIPYPEDVQRGVMDETQRIIRSHATWNERWAALRFRANKRQRCAEFFENLYSDNSDGEEFTDVTPFHTGIW